MKKSAFVFAALFCSSLLCAAQGSRLYRPAIQECDCRFRIDSSYLATAPPALRADSFYNFPVDSSYRRRCGYLLVPENRSRRNSRLIRLPFIVVESRNPAKKKDPILFTSGGPGNSSLRWASGITKSSLISDRDCIAFEQRGTRFAIPYLRVFDLDSAIRESYRSNLPKDSMWLEGVKRYRKHLEAKGIDLHGYNSDETVSDIGDLLTALHIDSVNLFGGSYSGGLMLAVLQKDPHRVRSVVIDSPLPMFSPIEEDEPVHFNEALRVLFDHCRQDSADVQTYGQLKERFYNYFTSITGRTFSIPYVEKGTSDTLLINYTKNELLDVVEGQLLDYQGLRTLPGVIVDIIKGNHEPYIRRKLDNIFSRFIAPDGMRMLVYCADQAAYYSRKRLAQVYKLYPYMRGYHINDVWGAVCDCWNARPLNPSSREPFFSSIPVLIADGEMDPACSPLYMYSLHHYLPNSQCFLFRNRTHGVGGEAFYDMTRQFVDHPYRPVSVPDEDIVPVRR